MVLLNFHKFMRKAWLHEREERLELELEVGTYFKSFYSIMAGFGSTTKLTYI